MTIHPFSTTYSGLAHRASSLNRDTQTSLNPATSFNSSDGQKRQSHPSEGRNLSCMSSVCPVISFQLNMLETPCSLKSQDPYGSTEVITFLMKTPNALKRNRQRLDCRSTSKSTAHIRFQLCTHLTILPCPPFLTC